MQYNESYEPLENATFLLAHIWYSIVATFVSQALWDKQNLLPMQFSACFDFLAANNLLDKVSSVFCFHHHQQCILYTSAAHEVR